MGFTLFCIVWKLRNNLLRIFFFCPSFCQKTQKYPTFKKKIAQMPYFFRAPKYNYTGSCGVPWKIAKNLALLYPATCTCRVFSYFFSKSTNPQLGVALYLWVFFKKILNTPLLGVEGYNKDKKVNNGLRTSMQKIRLIIT